MIHIIKQLGHYVHARILCIKYDHVIIKHNARVNFSSIFEGYNIISDNTLFRGEIGLCSYIGQNSIVVGKIGRFCSIARNVLFLEARHPTKEFVSTHPAFYSMGKQCGITFTNEQVFDEKPILNGSKYPFEVGNDVFIGAGAILLGPLRIGDGAIIAANSTVTHDVEPYSVIAGSPAKEIRKRFSEEDITYLLKIKWWENSIEWYKKNADALLSIEELKYRLGD